MPRPLTVSTIDTNQLIFMNFLKIIGMRRRRHGQRTGGGRGGPGKKIHDLINSVVAEFVQRPGRQGPRLCRAELQQMINFRRF